jgi:hypothetical protein
MGADVGQTIGAWVPHFSAIAPVLRDSDLIATLPSIAMIDTSKLYDLESRQVPFLIDPLPHVMLWSATRGNDPEIAWLRNRLGPLLRSKFTDLSSRSLPDARKTRRHIGGRR